MRKWNNGVLEYWGIAESPASGSGFATLTFPQEKLYYYNNPDL